MKYDLSLTYSVYQMMRLIHHIRMMRGKAVLEYNIRSASALVLKCLSGITTNRTDVV